MSTTTVAFQRDVPAPQRESLLRAAWNDLREIVRYFPLVRELVTSSLKTENVGTVLGYFWWLLHPLIQMAAYYVLVDVILNATKGPDAHRRFILLILTTTIAWKYFSAGVRNSINTTLNKEHRMRQVVFPKAVLPLSSLVAESARFLIGISIVVAVGPAFHHNPGYATPLILVVMVVQFVFGLAFALVCASLNFFLRDIANLVSYTFPLWYYLSPGLYPIDSVPQNWLHWYMINPFATILPAYQDIILDAKMPNFTNLGIVFGASSVLLAGAYLLFVRLQPYFAKVN
jgi:lipopolysaccharide transport system permease protein